jgi:hypothetical protein
MPETVILVHAGAWILHNFVELLEGTTVNVEQQGL